MQKTIELQKQEITYTLKVSNRAKRLSMSVHPGGQLAVTAPRFVGERSVEQFIVKHSEWVLKKMKSLSSVARQPSAREARADYLLHKELARALAEVKLRQFNALYGFTYHRVSIKNQKTCWGSCSKKGNINFNYKIVKIPERLADYVIVHELCHLGEFSHSAKFWALVARAIPDHLERRRELKHSGLHFL